MKQYKISQDQLNRLYSFLEGVDVKGNKQVKALATLFVELERLPPVEEIKINEPVDELG